MGLILLKDGVNFTDCLSAFEYWLLYNYFMDLLMELNIRRK